eukprot:9101377-Karenia_brevis.AAC.1
MATLAQSQGRFNMSPRRTSREQSDCFLPTCAMAFFGRSCMQPVQAQSVGTMRSRGLRRNKGRSREGSAP